MASNSRKINPHGSESSDVADVTIPASAIHYRFSRSSGPGGQNVNKVNTQVTMTICMGDLKKALTQKAYRRFQKLCANRIHQEQLAIKCSQWRSQIANRRGCLNKLRQLIDEAHLEPKRRIATKPSSRVNQKRLDRKAQQSQLKRLRRPVQKSDPH